MKLPTEEVERIRLASLVHDLGKLAVSDTILLKPTPLTSEEWAIVKKHPERGAAMLQEARAFSDLAELVLYHQESFDGTGFPSGLAGCEIPLGARIIRVADAFDALISDRPYRSRKELAEAKADLRQMAGTALDPKVVESLLRLLATIRPVDRQITAW
jgi:HD-GYP domain-containing protein (c-di-GMP phosphodiesterase class II)